jgi:tetratricopeptide (TPR) repeat protein
MTVGPSAVSRAFSFESARPKLISLFSFSMISAGVLLGATRPFKGNLDRAIADYSEAIRLDPKNAKAYYYRGVARATKRSLQQALADFATYSQLVPSDPDGPKFVAFIKKELSAR